jgi:hypothetical protein
MTQPKRSKQKFLLALLIIVVFVAAIVLISKHKSHQTIHVASAHAGTPKTVKSDSSASSDKQVTSSGFTAPSSTKGTTATTTLAAPTGTFVSNHQPSLSGSSSPSSEQSVCNTAAGATCYIEFTKDSVVKQLPTQTADSSGSVYWTWDVKQAGLTVGKWQITAVTTLNGQTKTAQDSLELSVQS